MGKRSIKENKTIYQTIREELGYTREMASEIIGSISPDKLVKIESGITPHADDVLAIAEAYKKPVLLNYYCAYECPIGREAVTDIKLTNLAQVTMSLLSSFNNIRKQQERLIEITADGKVSADELEDFKKIEAGLDDIQKSIEGIKLWMKNAEMNNEIK